VLLALNATAVLTLPAAGTLALQSSWQLVWLLTGRSTCVKNQQAHKLTSKNG